VNSSTDNDPAGSLPAFQMRVLVIEDNQDLARLFCDLLEVMGCDTEMAFNAKTGIASARKMQPNLVFCDLRLPGEKNGFDVAQELRADAAFSRMQLIAVTGYSDPEEQRRALDSGFDRVFAKPVKFAEIQEVLKDYQQQQR
jgi:CheY-like chemotaxis protein